MSGRAGGRAGSRTLSFIPGMGEGLGDRVATPIIQFFPMAYYY